MMILSEEYSGWKDIVTSAMCRTDSAGWFALVDPCADSRLPAILWELDNNPGIIPLFMNTMLHEVSMTGPLFVPLTPNSQLTGWILAESESIPLGCVYSVKKDESAGLFEHLQNLLECALPDSKPGIFRFFDPRVLYAVANYFDPVWMRYVAGQALSVYAWEPGCCKPVIYSDKGIVLAQEGIALEQGLLDAISEHTSPYAVISSMEGERGKTLREMALPEAYTFVKSVCDPITAMDIPYVRDLIVGTSVVMQLGDNIFNDDYIRQVVMGKRNDESLADVLREIPDSFFKERAQVQR